MKLLNVFATGDRQRLKKAARGDVRALERLYDDHVDALYSFVFYRSGRDPQIAEDVVQETFAKAIEDMDRFDPKRGSFRSWLLTLSRNVIRDHLRARKKLSTLEQWDRIDETLSQIFASLDQHPLSDEVIERSETRDLVNITIANLPEKYRAILVKKYIGGEGLSELATDLNISQEAAKSLLARARRAFREAFCALTQTLGEVTE